MDVPQEARDRDPSDIGRFDGGDTEEYTSIFTEEDAKPQRLYDGPPWEEKRGEILYDGPPWEEKRGEM